MDTIPKEIENIILDYKQQLELIHKYNIVIRQLNNIISLLLDRYYYEELLNSDIMKIIILDNDFLPYVFKLIDHKI